MSEQNGDCSRIRNTNVSVSIHPGSNSGPVPILFTPYTLSPGLPKFRNAEWSTLQCTRCQRLPFLLAENFHESSQYRTCFLAGCRLPVLHVVLDSNPERAVRAEARNR